jgi:PAS domain S-box-containing protein
MSQILIVDDNHQNLYLLEKLLRHHGHEVTTAHDGIEALDAAHRVSHDLVITDILMPKMDGFSLCRKWKEDEQLKDTPLVFYTATYTEPQDKTFALSLGADRFILKPEDNESFLKIMHEVLTEHDRGKSSAPSTPLADETSYLREYNETLVRKLAQRNESLSMANRKLKDDIAARQRIEEALRKSEEAYRIVVENVPAMIAHVDLELRYRFVNQNYASFFGHESQSLVGKHIVEVLGEDGLSIVKPHVERILKGHPLVNYEFDFPRTDGTRSWLSINYVPEHGEDDTVIGFFLLAVDIHQRKLAEERLQEAHEQLEHRVEKRTAELRATNDELEAFTYSVSHDLRAPIRHINGFAQMLLDSTADSLDSEETGYLNSIEQSSVKMGTLIDDLLRLSRLGRQALSIKDTNIDAMVRRVWAEVQASTGFAGEFHIDPLPPAKADQALLQVVWRNLLENAAKFSARSESPRITVRSSTVDGKTSYVVEDNGAGFDQRYAENLFSVFQRLHQEEDFAGTGIGLAIVHRIVTKHGGDIRATGEIGKGAKFEFWLGDDA